MSAVQGVEQFALVDLPLAKAACPMAVDLARDELTDNGCDRTVAGESAEPRNSAHVSAGTRTRAILSPGGPGAGLGVSRRRRSIIASKP